MRDLGLNGLADALRRAADALRRQSPHHVVVQWWEEEGRWGSYGLDPARVPAADRAGLARSVHFYRDALRDALQGPVSAEDLASAITATVAAVHEWQAMYGSGAASDAIRPRSAKRRETHA